MLTESLIYDPRNQVGLSISSTKQIPKLYSLEASGQKDIIECYIILRKKNSLTIQISKILLLSLSW